MIVSGNNFRSLAERNELSFSASMSIDNTTGHLEFGFSGDSENIKFQFSGGRMLDPDGKYFNSYLKDGAFTLSGNLETGAYEYYIDNKLNSSAGIKNDFKINKFFVNAEGCSVDLSCFVLAPPQNYFFEYSDKFELGSTLLGAVENNQEEEFIIFTGSVVGSNYELDLDVPTGMYDGTYLQDYKYFPNSGDLDECNGRYAVTPEYPLGVYHYHIANDWPYVMSCFKGSPATQISKITETTSGTNPSSMPEAWLTGEFFDRQTRPPQSDHIRHYTSGVSVEYSDDYAYIQSKGIPNHFYGPFVSNPNAVSQQDHLFKIPLSPETNPDENTPEELPTVMHMGDIGVAIDGVPIDLLTNEFYKNRNHWRVVAKPGELGLDKHNAHVQPNGKYHYHANPSGIISDYDFTTPNIVVTGIPENYPEFSGVGFSKYANAFGVNVFATSGVSDSKVLHAANVIAEYLDNDLDGIPDNINVVNSLFSNQASLLMASGAIIPHNMDYGKEGVSGVSLVTLGISGHHALQELKGTETNPTGVGEFDATLEKVLHLLTDYGWSDVYPSTFGVLSGSVLANYMDSGRGGHHEWCNTYLSHHLPCLDWGAVNPELYFESGKANGSYPSGSWYHYSNVTCDYSCQASKYFYWGVTTVLGAQTGRRAEISGEWEYVTPTGLQSGDPNFYNLLTDSLYSLPTGYLPTGLYSPSASTTVYADTGHSPLIGFAFDGYPIYGPKGYVDAENSGEVKVMESSYLPKNTDREPVYPKTIKQYNDLYIPYHVDLIAKEGAGLSAETSVILNTNFGDITKNFTAGEGTEEEVRLAGDKIGFNLTQGKKSPAKGNTQGSAGGNGGGVY